MEEHGPSKKMLPSKFRTRVDGPALGQTGHFLGKSARSALVRRKSPMEEFFCQHTLGLRVRSKGSELRTREQR